MNWWTSAGLGTAALSALVSIYGIVSARPKAKAEAEHIFAQTAELMIQSLREEVDRLRADQERAWKALAAERLVTSELRVELDRMRRRVQHLEDVIQENGLPVPPPV